MANLTGQLDGHVRLALAPTCWVDFQDLAHVRQCLVADNRLPRFAHLFSNARDETCRCIPGRGVSGTECRCTSLLCRVFRKELMTVVTYTWRTAFATCSRRILWICSRDGSVIKCKKQTGWRRG